MAKIGEFFQFYSFFCFYGASIKYVDFCHQLKIPQIKSKKYADFWYKSFWYKSGKLAIQIKDDYYINWKNTQIRRILIIFPKIWTGKVWIISRMQNEGKIDNRKTMITFLSDDFNAPRESQICENRLWNQPIRARFIFYCGLILV